METVDNPEEQRLLQMQLDIEALKVQVKDLSDKLKELEMSSSHV